MMSLLLFASNSSLILRLVSDNGITITLEHDLVPNAIGFRTSPRVVGGVRQTGNKQWAHTWDGKKTQHRFASGYSPYIVEAIMSGNTGIYSS